MTTDASTAAATTIHGPVPEDGGPLTGDPTSIGLPGFIAGSTAFGLAQAGVVPLDAAYIVANYKETQLTRVRNGQPVEVEIDSFPNARLTGHVDSLAPASGLEFALLPPDNATGNFTKIVQRIAVKILIDDADGLADKLRPGMSVVATVDTREDH